MPQPNKVLESFAAAVADVPDGAVIAFGGFAGPGTPYNLTRALLAQGEKGRARRLTCIANTTGGAHQPRLPDVGMLYRVHEGRLSTTAKSEQIANAISVRLPESYVASVGQRAYVVPVSMRPFIWLQGQLQARTAPA